VFRRGFKATLWTRAGPAGSKIFTTSLLSNVRWQRAYVRQTTRKRNMVAFTRLRRKLTVVKHSANYCKSSRMFTAASVRWGTGRGIGKGALNFSSRFEIRIHNFLRKTSVCARISRKCRVKGRSGGPNSCIGVYEYPQVCNPITSGGL